MVVDFIVIIGVISLLPFMFTIPSGIFCWEKQQAQPFFKWIDFAGVAEVSDGFLQYN